MTRYTIVLGAACIFSLCQAAGAQNIRYQIEPRILGDGYEITGGFIETDGTLGTLEPNNILSYAASVIGPVPYEFSSANQGAMVKFIGDILADASNLTVSEDTDPASDSVVEIFFAAYDNTGPECADCHQDLIFRNSRSVFGSGTTIVYDHHDQSDDLPDSELLNFDIGFPQAPFNFPAMVQLLGDFNASNAYEPEDIDLLCGAISTNSNDQQFDLNGSGTLEIADFELLLSTIGTLPGDADLNGTVEFSDFLKLSNSFGEAAGWNGGDGDCNGVVQFADFLTLSSNFGASAAAATVPEPGSLQMIVIGCFALIGLVRRR